MSEAITNARAANFDAEVLQAEQPVLVDFWAPWCAPCKAIAPLLEEMAVAYQGKLKVVKINIDEDEDAGELAAKYAVRAIPTLIVFKAGQLVAREMGQLSKAKLTELIDSHL